MIFRNFSRFSDFLTIFDNFWMLGAFYGFFVIFLDFNFFLFLFNFFWDLLDFFDFCNFCSFCIFLDFLSSLFFLVFWIPFKVNKVTTKSYHGYYCIPKVTKKKGQTQHNKPFLPEGQKKAWPKPSAGARSRPSERAISSSCSKHINHFGEQQAIQCLPTVDFHRTTLCAEASTSVYNCYLFDSFSLWNLFTLSVLHSMGLR